MTSWYCPLPFRHAFIDSTGVSACCNTPRYPVDLADWTTNPNLLKLQQEILAGQQPSECKNCVEQERTQGHSLRTSANRDYENQVFTDTSIEFIDYRSSNICNFKCRSCFPKFSHGIAQEVRNNEALKLFYPLLSSKTVSITDTNHQWIYDNIRQIKRLMLTGGEPTVMPEIKNIIERAVKENPEIKILITTNGSFTDPFWYELVERIPGIHWTLSLDAIGSAAQLIRHGTDWPTVEHNARWLAANSDSMDINTVVTNLNILQLKPLLTFVREIQATAIRSGCYHQFHVSHRPYVLAADNLSPEIKDQVINYLSDCLNLDLSDSQQNLVSGLLENIKQSEFNSTLWAKSEQFNLTLDGIRNENHYTLNYEN